MSWLIPIGLYLVALVIRLVAAEQIPFPTAEPSAYYVDIARNALGGEGLVSHSIWSFATPPLEVPKPAFELWLPMSTIVSIVPMAVLGSSYGSAQLGSAVLGSLVAPMAWAIAREAARTHGLDQRRGRAVAVASGLLAAALSPLVLGSVVPDSYIPFTVFILFSALLLPRALGVREGLDDGRTTSRLASFGLGLGMGLAYLSRQEVIWFGLTVLLMTWLVLRRRPGPMRLREGVARLWPVFAGGLLVVVPWLLRNRLVFDTFFPGQAVENMFLIDNEDIFAFSQRPSASAYLDQGLATILLNPILAIADSFLSVLAFTAFPIGIVGLVAVVVLRHSPALRRPTAVSALLVSSGLIFASTMLLFPVATLWGTFLHASGPLLVALIVMSALAGDALLARISELRGWDRPNIILAPVALIATAGLLAVFQLQVFAEQSRDTEETYRAIAAAIDELASDESDAPGTIITDHPMWLADATDRFAIALPDEDIDSVVRLAQRFDAPWVVVVGERGRYPDALLAADAAACLAAEPTPLTDTRPPTWLFQLEVTCRPT